MSLRYAFNQFKVAADQLEREEGIKYDAKPAKEIIAKMLDGYCDACDKGDEVRKNMYIAGLMLRFWYVIGKLKEKCPGLGLDDNDFMAWLFEAIEYACKYRKWQVDETVNAQQCINQCIETIRKQHYYEFNLDKHKANYNTISLENPMDEDGKVTLGDTLIDEATEDAAKMRDGDSAAREIVQMYLNRRKIVEAIILDTIAFNDTQKVTKQTKKGIDEEGNEYKYTTSTSEFWAFKVVQLLGKLPETYEEYFLNAYSINPDEFKAALEAIRKANNTKLYKFLNKTLQDARGVIGSKA